VGVNNFLRAGPNYFRQYTSMVLVGLAPYRPAPFCYVVLLKPPKLALVMTVVLNLRIRFHQI
jgi:hypothetical protein